jgi:HSP20 family protein
MARNSLSPFRSGGLAERGGYGGDPFLSLHREMNRLFDDVLRGSFGVPVQSGEQGRGMMMPHMDVSETENEVRICAELPGVSEKDVDVSLSDDVLTIRGEKKFERKDDTENYHFVERSYGTFQRSLRLPYAVDPDQVQASFENGVLTVTLSKGKEQERSRRIQVIGSNGQASQGEQNQNVRHQRL